MSRQAVMQNRLGVTRDYFYTYLEKLEKYEHAETEEEKNQIDFELYCLDELIAEEMRWQMNQGVPCV